MNTKAGYEVVKRSNGGQAEVELVRGGEVFAVRYDAQSRQTALRLLASWATSPSISFNWYDAAVMANQVRMGNL